MAVRSAMIFAAVVTAVANGAGSVPFKTDSCELVNSFKYEECGSTKLCCNSEEHCIEAEPWEGDKQYACSTERKLAGNKIVKIVLLPIVLSITFLGVAGYLITKLPKDLLTGLCITQVILSVFLLYSPVWLLGLYTVILNFLVVSGVTTKGLAWWAYRLLFILQMFHIIAIFGPFESFHVPFGGLSTYLNASASNNLETLAGGFSASEADCSAYYGNYFTLVPIELMKKDVDPKQNTFGYCFAEWLTIVQFICVVVGVVQCVIASRTGQLLLSSTPIAPAKKDDAPETDAVRPFTPSASAAPTIYSA
jgi:hypothetical protein